MIALISDSRPDGGQTVLETLALHDRVVEDGKVIRHIAGMSVMSSDPYPGVVRSVGPFLDRM